jgi:uncharacterized protein (DUF1684 family)
MSGSEWENRVRMEREQKDIFFRIHPQSPIPPEEREGFQGLQYYPPQPEYRFKLELQKHPVEKKVRMTYTRGEEQEFIRWGEFRFKIRGDEQVLQAYKNSAEEDRLFIPFRDPTNGEETYGAGRYLDLHADSDRTEGGKWVLDFNKAYNPWCAYNKDFTCPFVPPENWLKTPIHAGEKLVKKK